MQQRLQKLIALAGLASRRHAEELISAGLVTVNGKVVTELGTKADPQTDHIKVRGRLINPLLGKREKIYVLLNKPKGYLTSMADPEGRPDLDQLGDADQAGQGNGEDCGRALCPLQPRRRGRS